MGPVIFTSPCNYRYFHQFLLTVLKNVKTWLSCDICRGNLLNTKPELLIVAYVYSLPNDPTFELGLVLSVTL